jgi:hypothetical protein
VRDQQARLEALELLARQDDVAQRDPGGADERERGGRRSADDPRAAREEARTALNRLVDGLGAE